LLTIFHVNGIKNKDNKNKQRNQMDKEMFYEPSTGPDAGKRNYEAIIKHLERDPKATGVEIAKSLGLSLPTVYSHLKKLKKTTPGS